MSDEKAWPPRRVIATDATIDLIKLLRDNHGELMFHQSGGCCDGSAPCVIPRVNSGPVHRMS